MCVGGYARAGAWHSFWSSLIKYMFFNSTVSSYILSVGKGRVRVHACMHACVFFFLLATFVMKHML